MQKQFELTCPVHAYASPPSQRRNKSILSCQATALWKDPFRDGRSKAAPSEDGAPNAASLLAAGDQGRHAGEETCSKTHLSTLIRCQSTTKAQPTGWRSCCSPCSRVHWIGLSFSSRKSPWDIFLTLSIHRFFLRGWVFVATLPPSKQNVLARGEKNLTQDFDATFFFLETLLQKVCFVAGNQSRKCSWSKGFFSLG